MPELLLIAVLFGSVALITIVLRALNIIKD